MSVQSTDFFSSKSSFGSPSVDLEMDGQVPSKCSDYWRSVLVEGQCQSGKTFKVIQLLKKKIQANTGTLILIITQANSGASADQTLERMQTDFTDVVDIENMSKSSTAPVTFEPVKNQLVVDFWNIRNTDIMKECARNFQHVVVVIDEADQGGRIGISSRMRFVSDIELIVPDCRLFFVTATTANLSKAILKLSECDVSRFKRGSIVHDILFEETVEYQNVKPSDDYVSTSRMVEGDVWSVKYKSKTSFKDDQISYNDYKTGVILKKINELPSDKKELTMIAISSLTADHKNMVQPLMNTGYNVVVELNGNNIKDYNVSYMADGQIRTWKIPTKKIYQLADKKCLSRFSTMDSEFETGIVKKENIRLPDILQNFVERGARSTQRFGRACGNYFYKYKDDRRPIVIATEKIVEASLANYNAVYENSKKIKNGEMIALRNYIDESEWKEFKKCAKETLKNKKDADYANAIETRSTSDMAARVKKYMDPKEQTVVAKIFRYLYENTKDGSFVTIEELKEGIKYEKALENFQENIRSGSRSSLRLILKMGNAVQAKHEVLSRLNTCKYLVNCTDIGEDYFQGNLDTIISIVTQVAAMSHGGDKDGEEEDDEDEDDEEDIGEEDTENDDTEAEEDDEEEEGGGGDEDFYVVTKFSMKRKRV
eukprot:gene17529-23849_t